MKNLENIPKKNIYEVPDGYFDKLPGILQARVSKESPKKAVYFSWVTTLKYAVPVVIIGLAGLFWYTQSGQNDQDIDSILASIETEELIAYIDESEISTDELLDALSFDLEDVADIEDEVYGDIYDQELDALIDEYDIDITNL